jgi:hypothetical protein
MVMVAMESAYFFCFFVVLFHTCQSVRMGEGGENDSPSPVLWISIALLPIRIRLSILMPIQFRIRILPPVLQMLEHLNVIFIHSSALGYIFLNFLVLGSMLKFSRVKV